MTEHLEESLSGILPAGEPTEEMAGVAKLRGEIEGRLSTYLEERGFVQAVMERIYELHLHPRKSLAWGLFCLANLILLVVLGANGAFLEGFFPHAQLAQFFFLFLGITFLGGLVGLVLSVDTSRLLPPHHRD
jgi:hypothetical protein